MASACWRLEATGVRAANRRTCRLGRTGTYILTAVINWRKPIVLRGEGKDKTRLKFPKSLTDLWVA